MDQHVAALVARVIGQDQSSYRRTEGQKVSIDIQIIKEMEQQRHHRQRYRASEGQRRSWPYHGFLQPDYQIVTCVVRSTTPFDSILTHNLFFLKKNISKSVQFWSYLRASVMRKVVWRVNLQMVTECGPFLVRDQFLCLVVFLEHGVFLSGHNILRY